LSFHYKLIVVDKSGIGSEPAVHFPQQQNNIANHMIAEVN